MPPRLLEQFNAQTHPITVDILASSDDDGARTITARLVTFGEKTRDWRNMSFVKGAIAVDETLPLAYAHQTGGGFFGGSPVIVGKVLSVYEDDEAAYADMELSTTSDADEVWTLIQDGSLSKVSIGGRIVEYQFNEETEELTVLAFDMAELSIVPIPAMKSADIIRNEQPELVTLKPATQENTMPDDTPTVTDDTLEERLSTVEDLMRARLADEPSDDVTGKARPAEFRNVGDLLGAVSAMDLGKDQVAKERLGHALENGHVFFMPNGTRMIDIFAFQVGSTTDAATDPGHINDLLRILHDGRVIADHFAIGDLDTVPGKTVDAPTVTAGGAVDYQTEGGAVNSVKQTWSEDSFAKSTLAGGQTVTVQARDWSRPSYMNEVIEDLVADYGEKLNYECVNGDGLVGPPQHINGILTAQAARIDATATLASSETIAGEFVKSIGTAKGNVHTASKRWPAKMFMPGVTLGVLDGLTDTEGRPLLATDGPSNAIGVEDGASPAGRIRGLTVYADDAVPAGDAIISSFRDAKLWESSGAPIHVGLTYPDTLTVDVAVFGYQALAIRRAGSFAVINNIGVTV